MKTPGVSAADADTDRTIVQMLVIDHDGLWSVDEVVREIDGDTVAVTDALARLFAAGMIHRPVEGFVAATRSAVFAYALDR